MLAGFFLFGVSAEKKRGRNGQKKNAGIDFWGFVLVKLNYGSEGLLKPTQFIFLENIRDWI